MHSESRVRISVGLITFSFTQIAAGDQKSKNGIKAQAGTRAPLTKSPGQRCRVITHSSFERGYDDHNDDDEVLRHKRK